MSKYTSYFVVLIFGTMVAIIAVYYVARPLKVFTILHVLTGRYNNTEITTSCVTGRPCTYPDTVDIRVVVITFNRPTSLSKLLRSLDTLVLDGDRAALEIWIDRTTSGLVHNETNKVASAFKWKGGPTRVHIQTRSAGITGQWIDTWRPKDDSNAELGLILEDDINVSPYAYRWLRAVHRAYGQRSDFAGATIQTDQLNVLSSHPKTMRLAGPKNDTVFMYMAFGTWGWAPRPLRWKRFQDWFHEHKRSVSPHFKLNIPDTLPSSFYRVFERRRTQDLTWAMWFLQYMYVEQLYAVYSNLNVYTGGMENCLCINRREKGLHYKSKGREDYCRLMTIWKEEYTRFPKNTVRLHWDGSPVGNRLYSSTNS